MKSEENRVPKPWERQPEEAPKAFQAFVIYRDAEPKISAAKVGEKCGKSSSLTGRWCTRYRWKERREAWEDEKDRLMREELIKGVTAMRKSHADIAKQMLIKALKALQQIPVEEMTMQDVVRAVDVAAKLERLSRGDSTENKKISGEASIVHKGAVAVTPPPNLDLAPLSDGELEQLEQILGKLHSEPGI